MTRREFMAALSAFAAITPGLAQLIGAQAKPPALNAVPKRKPRSHFGGVPFDAQHFVADIRTDYGPLRDVFERFYVPPPPLRHDIEFSLSGKLKSGASARSLFDVHRTAGGVDIRIVGRTDTRMLSFEFKAFIKRLAIQNGCFEAEGFVLPTIDGKGFSLEVA
jgi:hypothetical protein